MKDEVREEKEETSTKITVRFSEEVGGCWTTIWKRVWIVSTHSNLASSIGPKFVSWWMSRREIRRMRLASTSRGGGGGWWQKEGGGRGDFSSWKSVGKALRQQRLLWCYPGSWRWSVWKSSQKGSGSRHHLKHLEKNVNFHFGTETQIKEGFKLAKLQSLID